MSLFIEKILTIVPNEWDCAVSTINEVKSLFY